MKNDLIINTVLDIIMKGRISVYILLNVCFVYLFIRDGLESSKKKTFQKSGKLLKREPIFFRHYVLW